MKNSSIDSLPLVSTVFPSVVLFFFQFSCFFFGINFLVRNNLYNNYIYIYILNFSGINFTKISNVHILSNLLLRRKKFQSLSIRRIQILCSNSERWWQLPVADYSTIIKPTLSVGKELPLSPNHCSFPERFRVFAFVRSADLVRFTHRYYMIFDAQRTYNVTYVTHT